MRTLRTWAQACLVMGVAGASFAQTPDTSSGALPVLPGATQPAPDLPAPTAAPVEAPAMEPLAATVAQPPAEPSAMEAAPPITLPTTPAAPPVPIPQQVMPATEPMPPGMAPVIEPAGTNIAPATSQTTPMVEEQVPDGFAFSYGNIPYSLMFTVEQIAKMKEALTTYETLRRTKSSADIVVEEEVLPEAPPVVEPKTYPSFTLRSIAYRNKSDWTVWVGTQSITPRTNTLEVHVDKVTPDQVSFSWTPEYMDVLVRRQQENKFADKSTITHRMTRPDTAMFDTQGRVITFALKPNQTFSSGYMATFEGSVLPPKMTPLPSAADESAASATGAATGTTIAPGQVIAPGQGLGQDQINRMYQRAGGSKTLNTEQSMDSLLEREQNQQKMSPNANMIPQARTTNTVVAPSAATPPVGGATVTSPGPQPTTIPPTTTP